MNYRYDPSIRLSDGNITWFTIIDASIRKLHNFPIKNTDSILKIDAMLPEIPLSLYLIPLEFRKYILLCILWQGALHQQIQNRAAIPEDAGFERLHGAVDEFLQNIQGGDDLKAAAHRRQQEVAFPGAVAGSFLDRLASRRRP